jgi:hypothetical protein
VIGVVRLYERGGGTDAGGVRFDCPVAVVWVGRRGYGLLVQQREFAPEDRAAVGP